MRSGAAGNHRQNRDEHRGGPRQDAYAISPLRAGTTPGATSDGWGGCTAAIYTLDANMKQNRPTNTARPETCDDLDDLHGLSLQMEREEMLYEVDFAVSYVAPTDLTQTVTGPTFAKALTLTITTPNYVVGNDPLEITMSQVFTYPRLTTTVP